MGSETLPKRETEESEASSRCRLVMMSLCQSYAFGSKTHHSMDADTGSSERCAPDVAPLKVAATFSSGTHPMAGLHWNSVMPSAARVA